ncbi:hypothetical protein ACLWBD_12600 [Bdellovibrio sp. HCB117]|uniref:hypothetical protein n=1 Tax=Bdellovibrio sp. HCB117 TaxID=3394359 RepID=UPI0039B5267E
MRFVTITIAIFSNIYFQPAQGSLISSPAGHFEAFLGNAGAALEGSAGNVLFNPAGLAFAADKKSFLSVAGTAIGYSELGQREGLKSEGQLNSRPLFTGYSSPYDENLRLSLFYSEFSNYTQYTQTASSDSEITYERSLVGLSYAGPISSKTAWGFTVGVDFQEKDVMTFQKTPVASEKDFQQQMFFYVQPGLMWQVSDKYTTGLSISWRALNLDSEGNTITSSVTNDLRRYSPDRDPLLGVTMGQGWNMERWKILADLSYAFESPQDKFWSLSLGAHTYRGSEMDVLFGFQHMSGASYFRDLGSIGVNFKQAHYQSTMGLYFQTFNGHEEGALTSSEFGVIFSASFEFWQKDR